MGYAIVFLFFGDLWRFYSVVYDLQIAVCCIMFPCYQACEASPTHKSLHY